MKDFLQTLLGIIIVGAVIMALILFFFPNPEALGRGSYEPPEQTQESEPETVTRTANNNSFASELLPQPEPLPVYEPLADELLTGEVYNRPKLALENMFSEEMQTVTASSGKSVAPSRIVVQKGDGPAYVWCEFEYDPAGEWMKQRIFPLNDGGQTYEILYNRYGSISKVGIGRKQLVTYDKGFPSEGIGMDREGRYRYFQREDTSIEYDTDLLFFQNHTDEPLYKIELVDDLVNHVREEKYYEQRISGGDFYVFQHRVIDDKDRMRRIVDFSRHDNTEPLLKASREYDEQARLISFQEYDKDRNITQEETFTYDDVSGHLTAHTRYTRISGIIEGAAVLLSGGDSGEDAVFGKEVRYSDYFDRPDNSTVRRLSVDGTSGYMEETTYHLNRDGAGRLGSVDAECGDVTRKETWSYDGNGNWISYRLLNGEEEAFRIQVSYRETAYPYDADVMQRRILSLEPLQYAAFLEEAVTDAFWWCAPECSVEERFVLSGFYY